MFINKIIYKYITHAYEQINQRNGYSYRPYSLAKINP